MRILKNMVNWIVVEPGWYFSPLGGICKESTGKWHCYVLKDKQDPVPPKISFKTLAEAKKWFEKGIK
jgi:hypothetical protein